MTNKDELLDQWVAGFANFVSFGASTTIRSNLYGEVAEQNHSGVMWNFGQLSGAGAAIIFGAATPENLTFSMGRSEWIATTYNALGTGVSAWETGTHIREGRLEWSDAFNLLPFVPFAAKGVKQFLGTAIDVNSSLRNWGEIQVISYLQQRYRSYQAGWTRETGAIITNKLNDADTSLYRPKHYEGITIQDGKLYNNGQLLHVPNNGELEFVIGLDSNLVLGQRHQYLAKIAGDKTQVQAAGRMNVKRGKISVIDNLSGHFLPSEAEVLDYPQLLRNAGLDLKGTRLQIYVEDTTRPSGARMAREIILE